jgi:Arc/MetJ-type ribon-helix-helix transcriptional regulator
VTQATRAKEYEQIATTQIAEIASRQGAYEDECAALREALTQMQSSSDETVETGQLQWAVLQARRAEGEAKRREAAASAKRNHVQSTLFRLQVRVPRPPSGTFPLPRTTRPSPNPLHFSHP